MSKSEVVALSAVHCEGLYLRLNDGRAMMINPEDAAEVSEWERDLELTVRDTGVAAMFNLEVTRADMNRTLRAAWV